MKTNMIKALPVAAIMALLSQTAHADTFSVGAGALAATSPYRGYDTKYYPLPVINYDGDTFYVHTLVAGYNLWKDQQNQLSIIAGYNPFSFRPGHSDNEQLKRLKKRHGTLMAGLAYSYNAEWGTIRTTLTGDTLDNSNGIVGDVAYLYAIKGDNWAVVPGVGVTWDSANQNKYYYGISNRESYRSGLESYKPNDSFTPYVEVSAKYSFNPQWQAFVTGRYTRLTNEIKDSPMVNKSYTGLLMTGVTYTF
ncbi:MipA/OmpV family protein [Rouxiella sp. WC2420]|uniref:MipA/OmpV family protein n=1 Tax=Rouxiella sp. WC2420 TaxID=3234145 RepID=A0AB39VK60_9GAMM